jgi:hypothetical protein
MNYNSKANLGLYRQRIADYRGRMNQILLYYQLIVIQNTKYTQRVPSTRAADRPAGGWPPEGCIIMTP